MKAGNPETLLKPRNTKQYLKKNKKHKLDNMSKVAIAHQMKKEVYSAFIDVSKATCFSCNKTLIASQNQVGHHAGGSNVGKVRPVCANFNCRKI
jgi:hypothetical protein